MHFLGMILGSFGIFGGRLKESHGYFPNPLRFSISSYPAGMALNS